MLAVFADVEHRLTFLTTTKDVAFFKIDASIWVWIAVRPFYKKNTREHLTLGFLK